MFWTNFMLFMYQMNEIPAQNINLIIKSYRVMSAYKQEFNFLLLLK